MPITFRHDAAAGLIGSFAAGQAAGRRRNQKYSMALLMQNQRDRFRLGALGAARGVRGRAGAAGNQIVGFHDPLADNDQLEAGDRRRNAAARRARARKERIAARRGVSPGSSFGVVPESSRRIPITQDDIDQKREDDLLRDKLQRENDIWTKENEAAHLARRREFNLKRLEGGDYAESQVTDAQGIMAEMDAIRADKGLTEEERVEQLIPRQAALDDILDDPQGAGMTEADVLGQNQYGDAWEGKGLNEIPWVVNDQGQLDLPKWLDPADLPNDKRIALGMRPLDDSAEQDKQAAKDKQAEDDFIIKRYNEYRKEVADENYAGPLPKGDDDAAFEQAQKDWAHEQRRRAELNAAGQPDGQAEGGLIPGQAGQQPMRRPGDPGLGDLDTGAPGAIDLEPDPVAPQPAPELPNPNMAGLEPGVLEAPAVSNAGFDLDSLRPQKFAHPDMQDAPGQLSGEEFNKAWKALNPGQSLRGPDGRIYIKR